MLLRPIRTGYILGLLAILSLSGCATGPVPYEIRGQAAPKINPDESGTPLSIVVRLYLLKDKEAFSQLGFDKITSGKSDIEIFGDSLIERSEVVLIPGAPFKSDKQLDAATKYLGVVAMFRQPDTNSWRYLLSADEIRRNGLNFQVENCYIKITKGTVTPIPGQQPGSTPTCKTGTFASSEQPPRVNDDKTVKPVKPAKNVTPTTSKKNTPTK